MARLGDFVNIKTGKLDANAASENGEYPFFTCSKEPLQIDTYSYDCECVLVAGNGDLNVKYYSGKFDAYQRTYIIESSNKDKLLVRYLYYFLDEYVETLRKQSIGGVIKYIKLGNLTEAIIPLPPMEEQRKIAAVLDKVSDLIAKRRRQLDKLDLLVKARFVEMFEKQEFQKVKLKAVLTAGFWLMPATPTFIENGSIPYITSKNIKNGTVDFSNVKYISVEDYEKISSTRPIKSGDILISMIGTLGQIAVVDTNYTRFYGQNLYCLRINKNLVNSHYFCKFFNLDKTQHLLCSQKNQSTQAYLKANHVESLTLPLPPIELQNQFADFVEQTEKTKTSISHSLEKLEILKKSLMQEYFG